jgi:hypothetical protein
MPIGNGGIIGVANNPTRYGCVWRLEFARTIQSREGWRLA